MKNIFFLFCSFFLLLFSDNLKSNYSLNAITISLRMQNSIKLDNELCSAIDSMLKSAIQLDTSLNKITAMQINTWNEIIIHPKYQNIPWIDTLLKNGAYSGDPYIDSLNKAFNLVKVTNSYGAIIFKFNDTLRVDLLANLYKSHPDIFSVGLNVYFYYDDPSDIIYINECAENNFVFANRSHSGPYCYIKVDMNNNLYTSKIIKYDTLRNVPTIYLWDIPDSYNCTVFKSVDDIIDSIKYSKDWWVRKHGIECAYSLFMPNISMSYGDVYDKFIQLKQEIQLRWNEFIIIFQDISQYDSCIYARKSASNALEKIKFPLSTKCLSNEIIDLSGRLNVRLSWSNQFRGITNFKLVISKVFGTEYKTIYLDSTIKDTTLIFSDVSSGRYSWDVFAKNQFGWELYDYNKNSCYFEVNDTKVSENKSDNEYDYFISPNPVTDYLHIWIQNELDNKIEIFSAFGIKVLETSSMKEIDVTNLPPGLYFAKAGTKINKFVKI